MAPSTSTSTSIRRSSRAPKPKVIFEARERIGRFRKITRSAKLRLMRQNASLGEHVDLEALDKQISRIDHAYTTSTSSTATRFGNDAAVDSEEEYDSDCSMEDDTEEETVEEELVDLSAENFQYVYADVLDRRESYDSRCEEGNEAYEYDDFVVDDDEEDDGEGSEGEGSEITLVLENGDEEEEEGGEQSGSEDEDGDGEVEDNETERKVSITSLSSPTSTPEKPEEAEERKVSICSTTSGSSGSSGLFVSEHPSVSQATLALLAAQEPFIDLPISEAEPEDVAEEITDAITLFSRRCNRNRTPLRLRVSKEMLEDEEVLDALELAGKLGLATGVDMGDSVGWVVGPKGMVV